MVYSDLVTPAEVLRVGQFNSSSEVGGDDYVSDAIDQAQSEVLEDFGDPPRKTRFTLDSQQTKYEYWYNNQKVFRIDKVYIVQDDNSLRAYTSGTASESGQEFTWTQAENAITFHADTVSAYNGNLVRVEFIPNNIYWLCKLKAALYLLDNSHINQSEDNAPTMGLRIFQRVKRIEEALKLPTAFGSEDEKFFDPTQGETVKQSRFWTY